MSWEIIESWKSYEHRETIMFTIENVDEGSIETCGITQMALNDFFDTEDLFEIAEQNFEENKDFRACKLNCVTTHC